MFYSNNKKTAYFSPGYLCIFMVPGLLKNPILTKDGGLIKYGIFDIR